MICKYKMTIRNIQFVFFIAVMSTTSDVRGCTVDAGFLCSMIAMLGVVIKTLYMSVQLLPLTLVVTAVMLKII